jgi:hypothetical protein
MKAKAQQAEFTVRQQDGRYQVFDKRGHYRQSFTTAAAAAEYVQAQQQKRHPRQHTAPVLAAAAVAVLISLAPVAVQATPTQQARPAPVKVCRWVHGTKICFVVTGGSGITPPIFKQQKGK